jgi:hypothetical protein
LHIRTGDSAAEKKRFAILRIERAEFRVAAFDTDGDIRAERPAIADIGTVAGVLVVIETFIAWPTFPLMKNPPASPLSARLMAGNANADAARAIARTVFFISYSNN